MLRTTLPSLSIKKGAIARRAAFLNSDLLETVRNLWLTNQPFALFSVPAERSTHAHWILARDLISSETQLRSCCDRAFVIATYESLVTHSRDSRLAPGIDTEPDRGLQFLYFSQWQEVVSDRGLEETDDTIGTADTSTSFTFGRVSEEYSTQLRQVFRHLHDGQVYQVNMTQRFSWKESGLRAIDRWWEANRKFNPPFAQLVFDGQTIYLGLSPEELCTFDGSTIVSCPIKGTAIQSTNELTTEKNLAEHRMIVDMVRNDIFNTTRAPVSVSPFAEAVSFGGIDHLVSCVESEAENLQLDNVLRIIGPGASITGAPKSSAIAIISDLETTPREIYCGASGLYDNGKFMLTLPIRTGWHVRGITTVASGGGIVQDSSIEGEWSELQRKLYWAHAF